MESIGMLTGVTAVVLLGLCCVEGHIVLNGTLISNERHLFHDLMANYEKSIRPVQNSSLALPVWFGLDFVRIEELDETSQYLTAHIFLKQRWEDLQLTWNPVDYGHVHHLNVPVNLLWIPDMALYNAAEPWELNLSNRAIVYSNGTVLWIPTKRVRVYCPMDWSDFPHDSHQCSFLFGSWTHSSKEITFSTFDGKDSVGMDFYTDHHKWKLSSHSASLEDRFYPCCPNTSYPLFQYNITLQRITTASSHPAFIQAMDNIFILLTFLVPVIFLLPTEDASNKTGMGFGIILSQILLLYIVYVESYMLALHPIMSVSVAYYAAAIVLAMVAMVMAVLVANVWARSKRRSDVPVLIRTVFLSRLTRICCIKREDYMFACDEKHGSVRTMRPLDDMSGDKESFSGQQEDSAHIINDYATATSAAEWRQLAVILDRILCILFLVITIAWLIGFKQH